MLTGALLMTSPHSEGTYVTTAMFAIMTIVVLGKAAKDLNGTVPVDSSSGEAVGDSTTMDSSYNSSTLLALPGFQRMDVMPFALTSFISLAVKILAYMLGLRRLRRGPGAIDESTTGLELFALTTKEDGQSAAFTGADFQNMARVDIQKARRQQRKQVEPTLKLAHVLRHSVKERLTFLPDALDDWCELRALDLTDCNLLAALPPWFGNFVNLRTLSLYSCSSLTELPSSIGLLIELNQLTLEGCKRLSTLPSEIGQLVNLTVLDLGNCTMLHELPNAIQDLKKLELLDLFGCNSLAGLPGSLVADTGEQLTAIIPVLISLLSLDLSYCDELRFLEETFCDFAKLKQLSLVGCKSLIKLPKGIDKLTTLETLDLGYCSRLKSLPLSIGNLRNFNFQTLNLGGCRKLKWLPAEVGSLVNLRSVSLMNCCSLAVFPTCLFKLNRLEHLDLSFCEQFKVLPDELFNLLNLKTLNLMHCTMLAVLPIGLGKMTKLGTLNLAHCSNLARPLPDLSHIKGLKCEAGDTSDLLKGWVQTGCAGVPVESGGINVQQKKPPANTPQKKKKRIFTGKKKKMAAAETDV